ncbi:hypothetical protein predicted by Glimmer/Critica [Sorangium cellulosum So ce56]|uniref:Uncharacterized protein n=1 Tax=Sorangium cellulosum (strain So ce56) TaxID=448385 RepID=A9GDG2_SORC5|nr:hypothetical protein predicted by Glimmer/Critica [Sorangium cellulosum So ce56]
MLNAFRHHGGDRGPGPTPRRCRWPVLNAFRHHGGDRTPTPNSETAAKPCSTPSGITAGIAGADVRDGAGEEQVLNAFRHHGGDRKGSCRRGSSSTCAQRLPASRRGSPPPEPPEPEPQPMCSTPSGITAGIARMPGALGRVPRVLNAFRHHGGDRPAHHKQLISFTNFSTPASSSLPRPPRAPRSRARPSSSSTFPRVGGHSRTRPALSTT